MLRKSQSWPIPDELGFNILYWFVSHPNPQREREPNGAQCTVQAEVFLLTHVSSFGLQWHMGARLHVNKSGGQIQAVSAWMTLQPLA